MSDIFICVKLAAFYLGIVMIIGGFAFGLAESPNVMRGLKIVWLGGALFFLGIVR